jgi:putative ABC transport system permease protein
LSAAYCTPNLFRALPVRAALGRTLQAEDAERASAPVVVIGDEVWEQAFGRDPGVIGKTFWVNGRAFSVVGVMGSGFRFPSAMRLWLPLTPSATREMSGLPLQVFGRLKPGRSPRGAAAELRTILLREPHPVTDSARLRPTASTTWTPLCAGHTA